MNNNNTRTTVKLPQESILAELNQAPVPPDLQEEIQKDLYDGLRRIFNAPIIFLTGVAMIPGAFASWLGSENKKQTNTNNFGVSPLTVFGGIVFVIVFFIGRQFVPEGKILLRYYMMQGIVNPQIQRLLEKGCVSDGGVIIPSHEEGVQATPIPGGNKCSWPNG